MTQYTHGLRGTIVYSPYASKNNGTLSTVHQRVTVVGPRVPRKDPVTDNAPAVVITETTPGYTVLTPTEEWRSPDRTGFMASGNYVAPEGDTGPWRSVFGTHGAIPLHDHTELWIHHGIRV